MHFSARSLVAVLPLLWFVGLPAIVIAGPDDAPRLKATPNRFSRIADRIRPLPPVAIPDNPPPHEGKMFRVPYRVAPPDLILVEVLTALPGRPITGERLVRTDGKIDLGWYGQIDVAGLTTDQIKVKVIYHLREYLNDQALGLVRIHTEMSDELLFEEAKKKGFVIREEYVTPNPFDLDGPPPSDNAPADLEVPGSKEDGDQAPPSIVAKPQRTRGKKQSRNDAPDEPQASPSKPLEQPKTIKIRFLPVEPIDSDSVFVDVTAHNSCVFYVGGDVATPGRLPYTGNDTVMDALIYAGGLLSSSDPENIRLYRPGPAGKPAREYKIDYSAILKGNAKANLQLFPGDRLVVGRRQPYKQ